MPCAMNCAPLIAAIRPNSRREMSSARGRTPAPLMGTARASTAMRPTTSGASKTVPASGAAASSASAATALSVIDNQNTDGPMTSLAARRWTITCASPFW